MKRFILTLIFFVPALSYCQVPPAAPAFFSSEAPSFYGVYLPPIPKTDCEGNLLTARLAVGLPCVERLGDLSNNRLGLPELCAKENLPTRIYWHQGGLGPYCHYVDFQGNDWFGWQEDGEFNWALAVQESLWVKESQDGRWLGYAKGNWWWKGDDSDGRLRLYRDGAYYLCDARGNIIDPKGEHPGVLKSDYKGPFQGDFMSRQVFYHPRGSHRAAAPAGNASPRSGARPVPAPVNQTFVWIRP